MLQEYAKHLPLDRLMDQAIYSVSEISVNNEVRCMAQLFSRLFVVGFLLCLPVSAQTSSGTILGVIRDPQQAPVPGAHVTATNIASNISKTFTTDQTGSYVITFLLPGPY